MDASCGTSKLTNSTMPTKVSAGPPRWNALPEGPLLRMFEVMAAQDDGRNGVYTSSRACCYVHTMDRFFSKDAAALLALLTRYVRDPVARV